MTCVCLLDLPLEVYCRSLQGEGDCDMSANWRLLITPNCAIKQTPCSIGVTFLEHSLSETVASNFPAEFLAPLIRGNSKSEIDVYTYLHFMDSAFNVQSVVLYLEFHVLYSIDLVQVGITQAVIQSSGRLAPLFFRIH